MSDDTPAARDGSTPVPDTADGLADRLATAASWLALAADRLSGAEPDAARQAAQMAQLGAQLAEDLPQRIHRLAGRRRPGRA